MQFSHQHFPKNKVLANLQFIWGKCVLGKLFRKNLFQEKRIAPNSITQTYYFKEYNITIWQSLKFKEKGNKKFEKNNIYMFNFDQTFLFLIWLHFLSRDCKII